MNYIFTTDFSEKNRRKKFSPPGKKLIQPQISTEFNFFAAYCPLYLLGCAKKSLFSFELSLVPSSLLSPLEGVLPQSQVTAVESLLITPISSGIIGEFPFFPS